MIKIENLVLGCHVRVPGGGVGIVKQLSLETREILVFEGNVLGKLWKESDLTGIPVTVKDLERWGLEKDEPIPGYIDYGSFDRSHKFHIVLREGLTNSQHHWGVHFDNDYFESVGSGEFTYLHEFEALYVAITQNSIWPCSIF